MLTDNEVRHIQSYVKNTLAEISYKNILANKTGKKCKKNKIVQELYLYLMALESFVIGDSYNFITRKDIENIYSRTRILNNNG